MGISRLRKLRYCLYSAYLHSSLWRQNFWLGRHIKWGPSPTSKVEGPDPLTLPHLCLCLTCTTTTTTTTTTLLLPPGLCLGQPGWASTRRNIHPLSRNPYEPKPNRHLRNGLPAFWHRSCSHTIEVNGDHWSCIRMVLSPHGFVPWWSCITILHTTSITPMCFHHLLQSIPWHPVCSIYLPDSLFPLSKFFFGLPLGLQIMKLMLNMFLFCH